MGLFDLFSNSEASFWRWFVRHESELLLEGYQHAKIFADLKARLERVNQHLTYEVGPADQRPRELVISADGRREAFFAVEKLADAAPALPNWRVIRFRPPMDGYATMRLEMGDITLRGQDMEFELRLERDRKLVGVRLYIRGCTTPGQQEFGGAAMLMLDVALGEYDVECKVGSVTVFPFDHAAEGKRFPFAEFRPQFERAFQKCLGRA